MDGTLSPTVVMALTMGFAIILFVIGLFKRRGHNKLIQACTARTSGIVSDFERRINTDTDDTEEQNKRLSYVYYPVFTYTVDGKEITKASSIGSGSMRLKRGQEVTVCYNPENVEQYYVLEDKLAARGSIIIMAFGVLIFVLSLAIPFLN